MRIQAALALFAALLRLRAARIPRPATAALPCIARDILECRLSDPPVRRLYLHAKALEALALVLDRVNGTARAAFGTREHKQLARARHLLDTRYGEDWSIAELSRTVGLSEKKLTAGFRIMAGRSVHAYLREARLDAAASMLASGHSVTQAALAAGFSSPSHFSKVFRTIKGVSPREWARS